MSTLIASLLIVTVASTAAHAQLPSAAELPARIDRVFARFDQTSPGCGVGAARDGRPLYTQGYGLANLEYRVANTDSTVFESGSVAKQFTATALVLLAQDGKLSLDDDIRKYLPEVPDFGGQKITIRNLLTHTSGLRDQWGLLGIEGRGPGTQVHTPMTTLDLVAHQKMLNFPPGSAYLYSNTGYALAGIIVQRVSGKSLNDFSEERMFRPLGMLHTQLRDDFTRVVPNRATAYSGSAGAGYRQDMPFTNMVGNGGVLATMGDLLKWNENFDHPVVGGADYARTMETQMRLTSGRTISYALGVQVDMYDGVREVSHSGSTAGYQTFLARYPDQRVSVAVWCNYAGANPVALARQVADLMLTKPQRNAATQAGAAAVKLSGAQLARWAGTYRESMTDQALIVVANDTALLTRAGSVSTAFTPLSDTRFRHRLGDTEFAGTAGSRTFSVVTAAGDSLRFEEVKPVVSVVPDDYVGTYTSDELNAEFTVAASNGRLVLRRRPYQEYALTPVYADDFISGGGLGSLRFRRDSSGRIAGFSFFAGRVLDVRFNKKGTR